MPRTILVVDDSLSMRQMVAFTLKAAGYSPVEACDGQHGLERLAAQRVDLIITDLNMPRLDGIGFIRALRALPACRQTPVIFLTTESQAAKRQEARAAGASAWVVKPFNPDSLLKVIGKVLP